MRMSVARERLVTMLKDTISLMCKSSLEYDIELNVEGLLGITLDKKEIMLVNINESFHSSVAQARPREQVVETTSIQTDEESSNESTLPVASRVRQNNARKRRRRSRESLVSDDQSVLSKTESEEENHGEEEIRQCSVKEERDENILIVKVETADDCDESFIMTEQNMEDNSHDSRTHSTYLPSADLSQDPSTEEAMPGPSVIARPESRISGMTQQGMVKKVKDETGRKNSHPVQMVDSAKLSKHFLSARTSCRYCGRLFQSVSGKVLHERRHLGKVVNCEVCQKSFTSNCDLKRHMWVHSVKRLECADCQRLFKGPDSLRVHRKTWCKALIQK